MKQKQQRPFNQPKRTLLSPEEKASGVRLNKFIALTGACNRREADKLILDGRISVNGIVVSELGTKVQSSDKVLCDNKELKPVNPVYILLNKPKNTDTLAENSTTKLSVLDLVKKAAKETLFPVGDLHKDTTGVMLVTNDRELLEELTQPNYNKKRIYHAFLNKEFSKEDLESVLKGIIVDDEIVKFKAVSYVDDADKTQLGIEITSGRNKIVRRVFEQLDYKVEKLDRVYFAGLTKKGLQRGHWRHLKKTEVASLKMGSYK